ncbi:tetratricopeptide repeat protein [Algibacter amylolyticus]|uniref:Tetratricopeptide repeat protein n=1 Tax=Algibacter amylolyticus TaxID=1608400 RepID=A0A5M7B3M8_9FLAO|nr:tetratricopeptide repeat protein [Algibacter amylolyticus]KAA5821915.1 tetratricopeptide repeat protein [Algibacter amylolyticus]MBB5269287.1 tetratricopeptide (TPR) repeat protein [Algibacter amylolyticus]TSJ73199.1 tetratricopeptide repeat protein [Algibacter amylolyticus]
MEFSHNDNNNLPITKFESMLKTNHVLFFDSEEFENIIHHYLNQGKIALAKKAIKLGLDQHPTSINLRLFKVEIYIFEDKLQEADDLLDELYSIDPSNEEIYIQKANIFSKKDDHEQAIKILKEAAKLAEDLVDLYSLIGMEYLFLDNYEEAKTYFMKCLKTDPNDYSALYNVIYCFEFLNQNEDAISYLNDFLNENPYCEVGWHQLGKQYVTLKEFEKALTAFDFAIISDDTFVGAYLELGKVLEELKRFDEAIANYTITLKLDDPTSFALLRIGSCYEKLNKDDLAIQYYDRTVHEDPLLDKGWIAITKFYNKKGNYQKALFFINKAINIDSENVTYWKLYSQINHRLSFYEEAERGYKKTIELGNYELNTWLSRGDLLIQLGEPQAAILNFEQAVEFYPENAELEYRLAGLFFVLMENDKGIFHLKNALKHNKDYAFIIDELFPKVSNKLLVKNILKQIEK